MGKIDFTPDEMIAKQRERLERAAAQESEESDAERKRRVEADRLAYLRRTARSDYKAGKMPQVIRRHHNEKAGRKK